MSNDFLEIQQILVFICIAPAPKGVWGRNFKTTNLPVL
jgi:hypothetical protein